MNPPLAITIGVVLLAMHAADVLTSLWRANEKPRKPTAR